jgi:hypothetical protein
MAIETIDNFGIYVGRNIDSRYGPYVDTDDANGAINEIFRYRGLTVLITGSGDIVEYWYYEGTDDINLVPKGAIASFSGVDTQVVFYSSSTAISGSPNITYNYLSNHFFVTGSSTLSGSTFLPGINDTSQQYVLTYNPVGGQVYYTSSNALSAVSTPLDIQDDSNPVISSPTFINFTGSGVSASVNGAGVDVYIPGDGGAFSVTGLNGQVVFFSGSTAISGSSDFIYDYINHIIKITGSLNISGSITLTGSINVSGSTNTIGISTITGSLNTSGSTTTVGTSTLTGSLLITGSTTIIGTSVLTGSSITSGSTNTIGISTLTGSLLITGSINTIGTSILTGSFNTSGSTNTIGISILTGSFNTSGSTTVIGISTLTGSLLITGSTTVIGTSILTGSFNTSGSTNTIGTSILTGSFNTSGSTTTIGTSTLTGSLRISGSTTTIGTSTFTGSLLITGSTTTVGTSILTGSLLITGSTTLTGSMFVTGAISASFGPNTIGFFGTASWAQSASNASFAQTASFITASNVWGPFGSNSVTSASYAFGINLDIKDEGTTIKSSPTFINFTGSNIIATVNGSGVDVFVDVSAAASSSFINLTTWDFYHNLNSRYIVVQALDTQHKQIIPENIELVNTSLARLTFPTPESGYAIATFGGGGANALTASFVTASNVWGPFGSSSVASSSYALTASFALNGGGGSGFPFLGNAIITGSLLVSGSNSGFSGITGSLFGTASYALTYPYNSTSSIIGNGTLATWNINHGFNTRNLHITVYESGSTGETVYPDIRRINNNTASIIFANPPLLNQYIVYISQ